MSDESHQTAAQNDPSHLLLPRAVALHKDGNLDLAAKLYREIIFASPGNFDATHLLGVVALQQGKFELAQRLIRSALHIQPSDVSAIANLATSFMHDGKLEPALEWFELAQTLEPNSSIANANLGTILHNMGRHHDAVASLRKAYMAEPHSYAVCMTLGASLVAIGEVDKATEFFEAATRAEPDNAEAWVHLASAHIASGRPEKAHETTDKALALKPQSSIVLGILGKAQYDLGKTTEAIESYRKGASVADASAHTLAGYGTALLSTGFHDEAIQQFERAIDLDGRLSLRWTAAIAHLKPTYSSMDEMEASRRAFAEALEEIQTRYQRLEVVEELFKAVGMTQPFYIAYQPYLNRELLRRYGALCNAWMTTLPTDVYDAGKCFGTADNLTHGKIRIGIVSSHIHQHSVWNAITRGWVYNIDRTHFEIHIFKLDGTSDRETDKAKDAVENFQDEPKSLSEWIHEISKKNLDVLIYPELGMHQLTLQLACLRLAPVQAASWGHPETSGLATMDLYISGDAFEPVNASENYVEELVRLPNLGVYVETLAPIISKPGLGSLNLPDDEPLLLCPGVPFKYLPLYDEVWLDIARRLRKKSFRRSSGGRLVFFRSGSDMADRMLESRLRKAFDKANVPFDEHISIIPKLERSRFFGLMRESALMLDTPGFSGFNTALQAIECDLPVLAFEGEFMRGRLASAIVRRLDLPELVATTKEDFIQKALDLAGDAGRRKKIRGKIIERRNLLFRDMDSIKALECRLTEAVASSRAKRSH